ncbi:MAG: hypothetical protein ACI9E5_000500 [Candidatus Omnitrophota bacterium]|jgi:hypothetical protein
MLGLLTRKMKATFFSNFFKTKDIVAEIYDFDRQFIYVDDERVLNVLNTLGQW